MTDDREHDAAAGALCRHPARRRLRTEERPLRLRSTTASQVDSSTSRNGAQRVSPAFAAKMSTRPSSSTACSTSRSLSSTLERSPL